MIFFSSGKRYNKENIPSRAYILFRRAEFLAAFSQAFDGHIYRDKTGEFCVVVFKNGLLREN